MMNEVVHHPLAKLVLGVVLAGLVKLLRKDKPFEGLGDELKVLGLPALLVASGALALGESYLEALTSGLMVLATALGLHSKVPVKEDKTDGPKKS